MIREAIIRFRRYFERNGITLGLSPLIMLFLAIYFRPAHWRLFTGLAIGLFAAPYPFRHALIRRIDKPLMLFLDSKLLTIGIGVAFVFVVFKQFLLGYCDMVAAVAATFGIQFWTRTDEMYVMTSWLAHPLEYGSPPDDITLVCTSRINWDDTPETCFLFRFRYGDRISTGITRPIVFSLSDPMLDLSPSEVLDRYRQWYQTDAREVINRDIHGRDADA